jgi:hypothetical protein
LLPISGRLYFRESQPPPTGEPFQTKGQLLVAQCRHQATVQSEPHLGVFDGGFALRSVVRPLVLPDQPTQPRIDLITRLRHSARLCAFPPLTGLQVVELFCARFRQEDSFHELKQRLGWEECRAWTKNPIVRTTQVLFVTPPLLRMWQWRLEAVAGDGWCLHPPWNPSKTRPSVLDVDRLLQQHRQEIQQSLTSWLEKDRKSEPATAERTVM